MEKHSRDFVKTSIIYLVLIITVYWTLQEPRVFSFQVDYRNTTEIDFSVFCWPIISLLLGLYLGRAVEYVFTGRWVRPLKLCLRYAGVISLIYLSLSSPQAPASLRFTSTIFLTGTGAMTLLLLIENTVAQGRKLLKYILKASRYLIYGATGYLLKDSSREELFKAIRAAARGEAVLAPAVAARLMGQMREPADDRLSNREIEVLQLVAGGSSNREIAKHLHISQATVKSHLIHIFSKLGVSDRTAAVTTALQRGILRLEP